MLWYPVLSNSDFRSAIGPDDITSSGKWVVHLPPGSTELWEELEDAACTGKLAAVKKSRDHRIVCVYCLASDQETVAETLAKLREIGVEGELQYKSDRATADGRDEYLWSSGDFESLGLKPF